MFLFYFVFKEALGKRGKTLLHQFINFIKLKVLEVRARPKNRRRQFMRSNDAVISDAKTGKCLVLLTINFFHQARCTWQVTHFSLPAVLNTEPEKCPQSVCVFKWNNYEIQTKYLYELCQN